MCSNIMLLHHTVHVKPRVVFTEQLRKPRAHDTVLHGIILCTRVYTTATRDSPRGHQTDDPCSRQTGRFWGNPKYPVARFRRGLGDDAVTSLRGSDSVARSIISSKAGVLSNRTDRYYLHRGDHQAGGRACVRAFVRRVRGVFTTVI